MGELRANFRFLTNTEKHAFFVTWRPGFILEYRIVQRIWRIIKLWEKKEQRHLENPIMEVLIVCAQTPDGVLTGQ